MAKLAVAWVLAFCVLGAVVSSPAGAQQDVDLDELLPEEISTAFVLSDDRFRPNDLSDYGDLACANEPEFITIDTMENHLREWTGTYWATRLGDVRTVGFNVTIGLHIADVGSAAEATNIANWFGAFGERCMNDLQPLPVVGEVYPTDGEALTGSAYAFLDVYDPSTGEHMGRRTMGFFAADRYLIGVDVAILANVVETRDGFMSNAADIREHAGSIADVLPTAGDGLLLGVALDPVARHLGELGVIAPLVEPVIPEPDPEPLVDETVAEPELVDDSVLVDEVTIPLEEDAVVQDEVQDADPLVTSEASPREPEVSIDEHTRLEDLSGEELTALTDEQFAELLADYDERTEIIAQPSYRFPVNSNYDSSNDGDSILDSRSGRRLVFGLPLAVLFWFIRVLKEPE